MPTVDYADQLASVIQDDPILAAWWQLRGRELGWANFTPRPDDAARFDEQAGFCHNRDQVAFLIGGNAAGTTEAAAYKTAQFVLHQQPPPRPSTPFWIISNTYDQVGDVCWAEKLDGHGHIPPCEVQWDRITWVNAKKNQPLTVDLKPWPAERLEAYRAENPEAKIDPRANWRLEFKSYEQGRRQFQAKSIGGFWFSEQFPLDLFVEVLRGCREYMFAGGQFAEFTPIEPELCIWVENVMDRAPKGWRFYRANTECNKSNLAAGWFEQFFGAVPDEMMATRMTGALATFEGVIYPSFQPAVHVKSIKDPGFRNPTALRGVHHFRGTDWGASEEHPFCCLWAYRDGIGTWWVYDEYWNNSQSAVTRDHAQEIASRWKWPAGDPHYGPLFADPSRPGEINAFNMGFEQTATMPACPSIATQPASNAVFEGINLVRSLLKVNPATGEPRLYICKERCPHLIDELRKYRWLKGRKPAGGAILNPKVAQPVPLKRDDDCVDALRYLIKSATGYEGATPDSMRYRAFEARRVGVNLDTTGVGARSQGGPSSGRQGIFKRTRQ
ncbi:MAG TPA: hypothetical protein VG125_33880 [Pirellulales bacterium]|nr:hypothetical protein [Pirellulales bacterium]